MTSTKYSFPVALNSKELLVAESIQARAWVALLGNGRAPDDVAAQAKLGRIVVRLIADMSQSIGGPATVALAALHEDRS
ncbi:MAG TPA: hypothetical protein VIU82_19680 [Bosea sp. (in: a-proteobacteria)]